MVGTGATPTDRRGRKERGDRPRSRSSRPGRWRRRKPRQGKYRLIEAPCSLCHHHQVGADNTPPPPPPPQFASRHRPRPRSEVGGADRTRSDGRGGSFWLYDEAEFQHPANVCLSASVERIEGVAASKYNNRYPTAIDVSERRQGTTGLQRTRSLHAVGLIFTLGLATIERASRRRMQLEWMEQ